MRDSLGTSLLSFLHLAQGLFYLSYAYEESIPRGGLCNPAHISAAKLDGRGNCQNQRQLCLRQLRKRSTMNLQNSPVGGEIKLSNGYTPECILNERD